MSTNSWIMQSDWFLPADKWDRTVKLRVHSLAQLQDVAYSVPDTDYLR